MYEQGAFYEQMQSYKRLAVDQFWQDYSKFTSGAILGSTLVILLLAGPNKAISSPVSTFVKSPILPLYTGLAGGIALSLCADRFNQLQRIETKIV